MQIFLDTEFTNFEDCDLISVGLVTTDGREFYAERNDFDRSKCSEFVREIVLPKLSTSPAVCGNKTEIGEAMLAWLLQIQDPIEVCSDHSIDWALFRKLLAESEHDAPLDITWRCISDQIKDLDIERYWTLHGCDDHHALHDARANKFAFEMQMRRNEP